MPDLFVAFARQSRVILDIGANSGFYTLLALSCSQAVVHAFEPFPPCQKVFTANLHLHPHANRARLHAAAVGEVRGLTKLYVPLADHGMLEKSCSLDPNFRRSQEAIEVNIIALDDEFAGLEGDQVDLMKIDVEGAEHRVIAGSRVLLSRARPVIFIEILTDEYAAQLREAFDGLGYNLFVVLSDRLAARSQFTRDPTAENYVAVPAERYAQFSQIASKVVTVDP